MGKPAKRTIALDIHDFSILRSRLDILLLLKDHYPQMKVSLFTIPYDYAYELTDLRTMKESFLESINANKDWMEFVPHGLTHIPREFEKADKETMKTYLKNVVGEMVKSGLPEDRIVKGFCAPQWLWNQDVIDSLDENGWWGAVDRNQPMMLAPKKFYVYTHSIDEPYWFSNQEVIKLHGHMSYPDTNNIEDCMMKLLKLPTDAEWKFASELVEENVGRTRDKD